MVDHNFEVNWEPLSEVKSNGMPKWAIQWKTNALAHVSVSVPFSGIASGHLVNRSTMVRRCVMAVVGQQGQCECDRIDGVAPQKPGVGLLCVVGPWILDKLCKSSPTGLLPCAPLSTHTYP